MKRWLVFGLLLGNACWAKDWYVPGSYTKISDAVSAASDGDNIYVSGGTYNEYVFVQKKINLIGIGTPTISYNSNYVVRFEANASDGASISGFRISGWASYGIRCTGSADPIIANNIISVASYNYGILCDSSSPNITNNTISGNGYGIYCFNNSSPSIYNNIITKNGYYGIYNSGGSPGINYNCVWGNGQNYSNCSPGPNDICKNPYFIGGDDYHLRASSPCIDSGTNTAAGIPAKDKDGNPRIKNGFVDMGAYEYQGVLPVVTVYSATGTLIGTYPTLLKAIDACPVNGTVSAESETYNESISVNKAIDLIGPSNKPATITPEGLGNVDAITFDGANATGMIRGFIIMGATGISNCAIYCKNSASPKIINNVITKNSSALHSFQGFPIVTNNTIIANTQHGVFLESNSRGSLTNNIIQANGGYGIFCESSFPSIEYNCVFGNSSNYCGIPDKTGENGNISANAQLIANYCLASTSSCINAGLNTAPFIPAKDKDGNPRIFNGIVDIGASEFQGSQPTFSVITGTITDVGKAPIKGARVEVEDIGYVITNENGTYSINVIPGTYTLVAKAEGFYGSYTENVWVDVSSSVEVNFVLENAITIYVRQGYTGIELGREYMPYNTIQEGVDFSANNGSVSVGEGTYYEGVYVYNKSPALMADNSTITVVGIANANAITFEGTQTRGIISGFRITGATQGRGIFCKNSAAPNIAGNTITGNLYGIFCSFATPTITGNTITANSQQGIYCSSSGGTITNNTISGNISQGIYCSFSSPIITNNTITTNHGIFCSSSSPIITNNTISAGNNYYGIYCSSSSPQIISNTISGCNNGIRYENYSSGTITNNTISGNSWGIYCYYSSPNIINNTISGNSQHGIYCDSSPNITNNTISKNSNCGIYCANFSSQITNNTISENGQHGIHIDRYSSPNITNNTVSKNKRHGIYCSYWSGYHPNIYNNIITENGTTIANYWGIYKESYSGNPVINYNDVWNNGLTGTQNYSSGCSAGLNDISSDPLFTSPSDFHLKSTSPCIDKGSNTYVPAWLTTDKDGNRRIVNNIVDMGAYEYQGVLPVVDVYDENGGFMGTYTKLSSAINACPENGTVSAGTGTYNESVSVNKRIAIIGPGNGLATITTEEMGNVDVITFEGANATGIIRGFVIMGATGTSKSGIYCKNFSNPCITGNVVLKNENGISCENASCILTNNVCIKNSSGILSSQGYLIVTNNTIATNTQHGIFLDNSRGSLTNNIIQANACYGIRSESSILDTGYNCVFGNLLNNYYGIPDKTGENGNISQDAQLDNNYCLMATSCCIEAGLNTAAALPDKDKDGNPRIANAIVDIGASEFQGSPPVLPTSTLTGTATDRLNIPISGVRISVEGFPYIAVTNINGTYTINVAEGTYTLIARLEGFYGSYTENVWVDEGSLVKANFVLETATTIYVNATYTGIELGTEYMPYNTTQEAVDFSANNGSVSVGEGTYYEEVYVGKRLNIIGDNSTITVAGIANGNAITFDGGEGILSGFTITGANQGKGIFCRNGAKPNIAGNTIINNSSGIFCNNSSPIITNNTISENSTATYFSNSSPNITNNIIIGNTCGILSSSGTSTITNNTISRNSRYGICCLSDFSLIYNNIITENGTMGASYYGIYRDAGSPTINYNNVWGNGYNYYNCSHSGSDISLNPQFVGENDYHLNPLSACIESGTNTAPGIPLLDRDGKERINRKVDAGAYEYQGEFQGSVTVYGPSGDVLGTYSSIQQGINTCPIGGTVSVDSGTYTEALYINKRISLIGFGMPTITTTGNIITFDSNLANDAFVSGFIIRGGTNGIMVSNYANPIITNNIITGNQYGISCHKSSPQIASNTISTNTNYGIDCTNSSPQIKGNIISTNTTHGIHCYSSLPQIASNTITGHTGDFSYGIYCESNSLGSITNNTITRNKNGIFCSSSSPQITGNIVSTNTTNGIYCNGSSPQIASNTISGNSQNGIYCYSNSSPQITNNTISGNSQHGIYCNSSSPQIASNTILSNNQRGIYCNSSSPQIASNTISGNSRGIYCANNSSPKITNNTISGGEYGIVCDSSSPIITNNTISGNTQQGIHCYFSSPNITNNTISRNTTQYGIYCYNSSPSIYNNIITENGTTDATYYGIKKEGSGNPTIHYNCVWGNGLGGNNNYYNCTGGIGSISLNPQFIGGGDFHLGSSSPCIDKGTNAAPALPQFDKDGNPRIVNWIADMGCYEFSAYPIKVYGTTGLIIKEVLKIQEGVNICPIGGTVSAKEGTYIEAIYINKRIALIGARASVCTITSAGLGNTNTVTFDTTSANNALISGFNIIGARIYYGWDYDGNGILCKSGASVIITNNIVSGNENYGIFCSSSSPNITSNTISGNSYYGIYCSSSSPNITNNTISGNNSYGIYCNWASPSITSNTILGNGQSGIYCAYSSPNVVNNLILKNSSSGIYCFSEWWCSIYPNITNNTIFGNIQNGIVCQNYSLPNIYNNIISENGTTGDYYGIYNNGGTPIINHNCLFNNGTSGENHYFSCYHQGKNISINPQFLSAIDHRLSTNSPCIGGGSNTAPGISTTDRDGNPRCVGNNVDLGAYEYQTATFGSISVYNPAGALIGTYSSIQQGINACPTDGTVSVPPGTWQAPCYISGKIFLIGESIDSIIDLSLFSDEIIFDGSLTENAIISSFTITNGNYGILCKNSAKPVISGNTIKGNKNGISSFSPPVIINNSFLENINGISCFGTLSPTIANNIFLRNTETAIFCGTLSTPLIVNNVILRNTGTAAIYCDNGLPLIFNNIFTENGTAGDYYVVYNNGGTPTIDYNCIFNNGNTGTNTYFPYTGQSHNIFQNPEFISSDDQRPGSGSFCINRGLNVAGLPATDRDGNIRILQGRVDMGAYEFLNPTPLFTIYVPGTYSTIQTAIDCANLSESVFVCVGTYTEAIYINKKINVIGEVATGTIISAGISDTNTITFDGNGANGALISGFTITGATGTLCWNGNGIYCKNEADPIISRNIISSNNNNGIYCSNSFGTISGNTIMGNIQNGIYCEASTSTIVNNLIGQNKLNGISCDNSSSPIVNNTIIENANHGISLELSNILIFNNIIFRNGTESNEAYGIYKYVNDTSDPTIAFNDVGTNGAGGGNNYGNLYGGEGNISKDPLFIGGGDYHLTSASPCLDKGTNAIPGFILPEIDKDGGTRTINAIIDMGCYEFQGIPIFLLVYVYGTSGGLLGIYEKIQEGINVCPSGGTISVGKKIYPYAERITINKDITIIGSNTPTIKPDTEGPAVTFDGLVCGSSSISSIIITGAIGDDGYGIYCKNSANPTIFDNTISDNASNGVHTDGASPNITRNTIFGNKNGIYCKSSSPFITNNIIEANREDGVYCRTSSLFITNNNILKSVCNGIFCHQSSIFITNNIIVENGTTRNDCYGVNNSYLYPGSLTISYNNIKDNGLSRNNNYYNCSPSLNNISSNPLFVGADDYHLISGSPCIDKGTNNVSGLPLIDRDANLRIINGIVDIGCYEFQGTPTIFPIIYVSLYGSDTAGSGTLDSPFKTIQKGINECMEEGTVCVLAGTYTERITINKGITLIGSNTPTIKANSQGPVVTFSGSACGSSSISSFIITGGSGTTGYGIYCINSASPFIFDNTILGNEAGIYCKISSSPYISHNTILNNKYAGVYSNSTPFIVNNIIIENEDGIFCYNSSCLILNNTISGNTKYGIFLNLLSSPVITNNIITKNGTSGTYYGIYNSPSFSGTPTLNYNCVFYNGEDSNKNYFNCFKGESDISENPRFVRDNDYRLLSNSPCIDKGTNIQDIPSIDKDGNPRIVNSIADMGAYEFQGTSTIWTTIYVSLSGSDITGSGTLDNPFRTIQKGINECMEGGTVCVLAGTYPERITINKGITLIGSNTPTIKPIDAGPVVTFDGIVCGSSSISSFIITGAIGDDGYGIYCKNFANPTIFNNTISGNNKAGVYSDPSSLPFIMSNSILENEEQGLYINGNPFIVNNIIVKNCFDGIYCYKGSPIITNNTISGNLGNGIFCTMFSSPIIENNIIAENGRIVDGYYGVYNYSGSPTINYNCLWNNGYYGIQNYYNCSAGINDISSNPQFQPSAFNLQPNSPCIDKGSNTAIAIPSTDKEGNLRIIRIVDMGCYEFAGDFFQIRFLLPTSGGVGEPITIKGNTSATETIISIDFGSKETITTTQVSLLGTFSLSFLVESQTLGTKVITARTNGFFSTTTFEIIKITSITKNGTITYIIDGDSFVAKINGGNETIRLLAVDCPEFGELFFDEAKNFASDTLLNKNVDIIYSANPDLQRDIYNRLLALIIIGTETFNISLLSKGLAKRMFIYNDLINFPVYEDIEIEAKKNGLNIWSNLGRDGIVITEINPNPFPFPDSSVEFVELYNTNTTNVSIGSSTFLSGAKTTLPNITIPPFSYLILARTDTTGFRTIYPNTPFNANIINVGDELMLLNTSNPKENLAIYLKSWDGAYQDSLVYNLAWDEGGANNTGKSLYKKNILLTNFGDCETNGLDDINWETGTPTPGFSLQDPPILSLTTPTTFFKAYKQGTDSLTIYYTYTELYPLNLTLVIAKETTEATKTTITNLIDGRDMQGSLTIHWNEKPEGSYTIAGTLTDTLGNAGTATQSYSLIIDNTMPQIPSLVSIVNPHLDGQLNIIWAGGTDTNLAGYRIYYGTQSGSYTQTQDTGTIATTYTLGSLTNAICYYIAISAYDKADNECDRSNEKSGTPTGELSWIKIEVSTTTITTDDTLPLDIKGYDTASNTIGYIPGTWTIDPALGSFTPEYGTMTVFDPTKTGIATITATDGQHTDTITITVSYGTITSLSLEPKATSITADGSQTLTAIANDTKGNTWTTKAEFSADKGTFTENIYYPKEAGTITITGIYSGKIATATVIVISGTYHSFKLILSHNSINIPTKGTFTITIIPYDRYNNQTNYNGTATITDLTKTLNPRETGPINSGWNGSFTITNSINGGISTITAILGTMAITATITVYIEPETTQTIGSDDGTITLIETGSLTEAFRIVITNAKDYPTFTTTRPAGAIGLCIDVRIIGSSNTEFHESFTIFVSVPYNELNLGNVDESTLKLYTFNGISWEEILCSWVDTQNNIIYGTLTHLSLIAILGKTLPANDLKSVIVYPNPCKQYPEIIFLYLTDQCRIRIYNIAGELVFEQEYTNTNGRVEWKLKNKQGNPVASGVYIYLITNNQKQKAIGKIAIIK
ncbi:MAG: right-handed parallel beta-helix repeat-containing protein [bacterium]